MVERYPTLNGAIVDEAPEPSLPAPFIHDNRNQLSYTYADGASFTLKSAYASSFNTGPVPGTSFSAASDVGMQFVTNETITITSLARWKLAGNSGSHVVAIMDSPTNILASVVIDLGSAPLTEDFNYVPLVTPVVLPAGTYYLMCDKTGTDTWYEGASTGNSGNPVSGISSELASIDSYYLASGVFQHAAANCCYVPVNFRYHT